MLLITLLTAAFAGCETDMDCKGARVCEAGTCRDPAPGSAVLPPPSTVTPSQPTRTVQDDLLLRRTRGRATTAFAGAGATFVFGGAAAGTNGQGAVPTALGSVALLSFAVTCPIAANGANEARRLAASRGLLPPDRALQTVAWIGYGLGLVNGSALVALGVADEDAPTAAIVSTVLLGTTSAVAFGVDALTAARSVEDQLGPAVSTRRRLHWTPVAGWTGEHVELGVVARF